MARPAADGSAGIRLRSREPRAKRRKFAAFGAGRSAAIGDDRLLTAAFPAAKGWPRFSDTLKDSNVAKPGLGTKRLCPHCAAKFYDLEKTPIVCPKCGSVVELVVASTRGRAEPARAAAARSEEIEAPAGQDAEFVSLEEADAEATGTKVGAAPDEAEDDDVEIEEEDETFLEEDEDADDDVADIIGGDIEDEEET
jgi:uncharacterized protein (TIGR02300 family)